MRYANIAMAIVFLVFAGLQYNDPDWLLWILAYGYVAMVSLVAASGRATWLPLVGVVVCAPWFVRLAPTIDAGWYHSEEAREGLGLLIATVWMGALSYMWLRSRGGREMHGDPRPS